MQKIPIYHIEDEGDWRDIIEGIITKSTNLQYISMSSNIFDAVANLKNINGPGIVLLDLRLESQNEHQTIVETFDVIPVLQNKGIDVMILSGFLPSVGRSILKQRGIPDEHIFEKNKDWRENFIEVIKRSEERLTNLSTREKYRIIHISDVHIGQENKNAVLHKDVRNELLRDVAKFRNINGHADYIFITGDIVYSGKETEYTEARQWLKEMCDAAGCVEDNVLIIPGNHDVDWLRITPSVGLFHYSIYSAKTDDELISNLSIFDNDDTACNLLLTKLESYRKFASKYNSNFESYKKPYWTRDLTFKEGPTIRIIGLNSALFSGKNDSLGNLALTPNQYILPRLENLEYLVLLHHPLSWFKNANTISRYLENRTRVLLLGHEHNLKINSSKNVTGYERLEVYAGATNPPSGDGYEFRYNWLDISIKGGEQKKLNFRIFPRIWTSATKFAPDRNLIDGKESKNFSFPISS